MYKMITICIEINGLNKTFIAKTLYLDSICTRVPTENYINFDIILLVRAVLLLQPWKVSSGLCGGLGGNWGAPNA